MAVEGLTDRQAEVLVVLIEHLLEHQHHLPVRGIADRIGVCSTGCVQGHLHALERKGYLDMGAKGRIGRRVLRWPDGRQFRMVGVCGR